MENPPFDLNGFIQMRFFKPFERPPIQHFQFTSISTKRWVKQTSILHAWFQSQILFDKILNINHLPKFELSALKLIWSPNQVRFASGAVQMLMGANDILSRVL